MTTPKRSLGVCKGIYKKQKRAELYSLPLLARKIILCCCAITAVLWNGKRSLWNKRNVSSWQNWMETMGLTSACSVLSSWVFLVTAMEMCRHQEHSPTNKGTGKQVLSGNAAPRTLVSKILNSRSELKWRKEGNNFPASQGPGSCSLKSQRFFCEDFIVDTVNIGSSQEWEKHYR